MKNDLKYDLFLKYDLLPGDLKPVKFWEVQGLIQRSFATGQPSTTFWHQINEKLKYLKLFWMNLPLAQCLIQLRSM